MHVRNYMKSTWEEKKAFQPGMCGPRGRHRAIATPSNLTTWSVQEARTAERLSVGAPGRSGRCDKGAARTLSGPTARHGGGGRCCRGWRYAREAPSSSDQLHATVVPPRLRRERPGRRAPGRGRAGRTGADQCSFRRPDQTGSRRPAHEQLAGGLGGHPRQVHGYFRPGSAGATLLQLKRALL